MPFTAWTVPSGVWKRVRKSETCSNEVDTAVSYTVRLRGSNASRRPSPKKLMLSTVNRINMPGKNQSQGAESRYFADLSSILPQLAVGSCTPSPRKLIYDSERIAFATLNVDETMIGAIVFGKICKKMISELDVPV